MATLLVPESLHDESNKHQPYSSGAVFDGHVRRGAQPSYSAADLGDVSAANQAIADTLYNGATGAPSTNTEPDHMLGAEDGGAANVSSWLAKRIFCRDMLMCILVRMRNQHVMPFMLICVSVMAYKDGLADEMWHMLEGRYKVKFGIDHHPT